MTYLVGLDKYIGIEHDLAQLLYPNCDIVTLNGILYAESRKSPGSFTTSMPKWARDSEEAFSLLVRERCETIFLPFTVCATIRRGNDKIFSAIEARTDHDGSIEAAARFAIVRVVIAARAAEVIATERPSDPSVTGRAAT